MDNNIEINTQILDSDKGNMIADLQKVRSEMKSMFEEVNDLNGMWEGPANSAFNEQFKLDYGTLTDICNSLQKYIECMDFASKEYVKCENSIGSAIAAIKL